MVSHSDKTRAAKSARVYGKGERERPTEKGVALDQAPCEGLEEPAAGEVAARTAPLDPTEALANSVEDLDCRVAELERGMLVVANDGARAERAMKTACGARDDVSILRRMLRGQASSQFRVNVALALASACAMLLAAAAVLGR